MSAACTVPCRYQGRLTWKGQTNIRNPAIVVAMELLLESLRPARPPLEPAPPLTAGLVALPNQLSQGGGAGGWQAWRIAAIGLLLLLLSHAFRWPWMA